MAIDWEALERGADSAIENAANRTDEKLSSAVSSLTRLTDEEVEMLFPEPADVKKLARLMKIVKSAEDKNTKIMRIKENIEYFGDITLTLLDKLV